MGIVLQADYKIILSGRDDDRHGDEVVLAPLTS